MTKEVEKLIKENKVSLARYYIDLYSNEHYGVFEEKNMHVHEFVFTSKDYDTGKWWDGSKLVPMTKTVVGLCDNLNSITKKNCSFLFNKHSKKDDSVNTTTTDSTIDADDLLESFEKKQDAFGYVFTISLKTQIATLVACRYIALGMCVKCKTPIYCNEQVDDIGEFVCYYFECESARCSGYPSIYKYQHVNTDLKMDMKSLIIFIDDMITYFSYGDCLYKVIPGLRKQPRFTVKKYTFIDSKFTHNRMIDDKNHCSVTCQVISYRKEIKQ